MVWVEDGAVQAVLVYSDAGGRVARKAYTWMHLKRRGATRFTFHVVSPLGPINYLGPLRELISGNIAYTISFRYSGGTPRDLEELARRLGSEAVYIVDHSLTEYLEVLEKLGLKPIT